MLELSSLIIVNQSVKPSKAYEKNTDILGFLLSYCILKHTYIYQIVFLIFLIYKLYGNVFFYFKENFCLN